ncbi:Bifunctional DNA-binding transcriptional regulator [Methanophagales archaeon]|nr:Bifunctional DNA-binding transcriptional regulator [Methanophagales archaeon]
MIEMAHFYGVVTVSDKGQIAIPIDVRRELEIKTGDLLIVIKRKDNAGIILLKTEKMDTLIEKIRDDDSFFAGKNEDI